MLIRKPDLELIIESQTVPALLCDVNGDVLWCNVALRAQLGLSNRQVQGSHVSYWLGDGQELSSMVSQVAQNPGQAIKLDVVLSVNTTNGQGLGIQAVLTGTENTAFPVLIELLNHAPALKAQAAHHRAEQQSAQRELLRNLAHEIRNPLGGIRGAAQLLARASNDPASQEYTDVIVSEASRLQSLLDRLLSAQAAAHTRSFVNIHEIFERVRSIVSAEYPSALTWVRDYDVSLPDIWADEHQLVQVFLNIVRNAAQMLLQQEQPEKIITLSSRSIRQATLGAHRHKLALELLIIDNGPGIPANLRPHLFNPLVTGRQGGTGLGLHIAQSFVQQHGGHIEADSGAGKTIFRVLLPVMAS